MIFLSLQPYWLLYPKILQILKLWWEYVHKTYNTQSEEQKGNSIMECSMEHIPVRSDILLR